MASPLYAAIDMENKKNVYIIFNKNSFNLSIGQAVGEPECKQTRYVQFPITISGHHACRSCFNFETVYSTPLVPDTEK
jgi:hypothetical protein